MAVSPDKRDIRQRMRSMREALPRAELDQRSRRICDRISALRLFQDGRSVGLFWPLLERGEVDVRSLDTSARAAGKLVFYPFMERGGDSRKMGFRRVDDPATLRQRGAGFAEPEPEAAEARRGDIDLVVVPAVAATAAGYRLGYGSGFYDVALGELCPPARSLVVVYAFQLLSDLPVEEYDRACDVVVTEQRLLDPGNAIGG